MDGYIYIYIYIYKRWFRDGEKPTDKQELAIMRRNMGQYVMIDNHLFRKGYSMPLLRCVESQQKKRIIQQVHEGICGSHIGERALYQDLASMILLADPKGGLYFVC